MRTQKVTGAARSRHVTGGVAAHRRANQSAARNAESHPRQRGTSVRLQGPADRLGDRDRRSRSDCGGTAARGREAGRVARILHRSVPARRRGSLLLAPHGGRRTAAGSLRAQLRAMDRRVQDVGAGGGARDTALATGARSYPSFTVRGRDACRRAVRGRPLAEATAAHRLRRPPYIP